MVKLLSIGAEDAETFGKNGMTMQAVWFLMHCLIALAAWLAMMLVGYIVNPTSVPQIIVLALSFVVPMAVGYTVARVRPQEMATHIWLGGIIWILVVCLWITDMPTGPNACMGCTATEKLSRTLFSIPSPSGLIDDNGPFFGTWPAVAMIGYAIGARFVWGKREEE